MKMPRQARTKSRSNIYHVMLRGVNKQVIFEEDEDRRVFLGLVRKCKEVSGFRLHAFCLMTNHVHLLIEPAGEPLDVIFKRVGSGYAFWYNKKYQRTGHLFQDRFRSENVETDQYYMVVLRYILQNPMKAGIETAPGTYRWSSYRAYEKGSGSITDTQYAEALFGSRENVIEFVNRQNDDVIMDEGIAASRLREEAAKGIMEKVSGCTTTAEFQRLELPLRKQCFREMYMQGLSLAQIARRTGFSKTQVFNAVKQLDPQTLLGREAFPLREADECVYLNEMEPSLFVPDADEIW